MHLQTRLHSLARILLNWGVVHGDAETARDRIGVGNSCVAIAVKPTMVAARHKPGRASAVDANGEWRAWGKWNNPRCHTRTCLPAWFRANPARQRLNLTLKLVEQRGARTPGVSWFQRP